MKIFMNFKPIIVQPGKRHKFGCRVLILLPCLLLAAVGVHLAAAAGEQGYRRVTGPCGLTFPRDHGAHPDYRTEWWYYTGNLTDENQRPFGFQLTFFRSALRPPDEPDAPAHPSAWRTRQVYLAHAAVSDIEGGRHLTAEKMARAAMDLAGADMQGDAVTIRLLDWQARITPQQQHLRAAADNFSIDLALVPLKPLVLQGDQGYSRKGQAPGRASCYYSFTRLQTSGVLTLEGRRFTVSGSSWMDHEFSSAPLQPGITGWDWFSVQLSDGSEMMMFLLREQGGGINPASSGTFVYADGRTLALKDTDITAVVLDYWHSPHSGAFYPSVWKVTVAPLELTLRITPNLADQEMQTPGTSRVTYWEGSVQVQGRYPKRDVDGAGYVELTGYAAPFEAPM